MSDTYSVRIKDAQSGSSFTLYLDEYPMSIVGGKAPEESFTIDIPNEYTGHGKFKIFAKVANRTLQNVAYSVIVDLAGDGDDVVSFAQEPYVKTPAEEPKSEPPVENTAVEEQNDSEPVSLKNDLRDEALETIKSSTENKLREKIQSKKSGNSFWDNLK